MVKDFAGEEIANAIINDLLDKYGKEEIIDDREYIKKFLNLFGKKNDITEKPIDIIPLLFLFFYFKSHGNRRK